MLAIQASRDMKRGRLRHIFSVCANISSFDRSRSSGSPQGYGV